MDPEWLTNMKLVAFQFPDYHNKMTKCYGEIPDDTERIVGVASRIERLYRGGKDINGLEKIANSFTEDLLFLFRNFETLNFRYYSKEVISKELIN